MLATPDFSELNFENMTMTSILYKDDVPNSVLSIFCCSIISNFSLFGLFLGLLWFQGAITEIRIGS